MKKILFSALLLAFFTFGLSLFSGCPRCKCGLEKPYYDFSQITALPLTSRIASGDSLLLEIEFSDLDYLATTNRNWSGFGALYACSCQEPGYEGAKYPIEGIEITSDQDFSQAYPAGSSLNDLFRIDLPSTHLGYPANDLESLSLLSAQSFFLTLGTRPDSINLPHVFQVQLRKSNGETVANATESIVWD